MQKLTFCLITVEWIVLFFFFQAREKRNNAKAIVEIPKWNAFYWIGTRKGLTNQMNEQKLFSYTKQKLNV